MVYFLFRFSVCLCDSDVVLGGTLQVILSLHGCPVVERLIAQVLMALHGQRESAHGMFVDHDHSSWWT
jgi:hypothetical protein